ncbi:MAG: hypothetical protein WDA24_03775 [Tissierellales bacterium]
MRIRRKEILQTLIIILSLIFGLSSFSLATNQKVLIIVLDELDLDTTKKIISNNASLGIMSVKTAELYRKGNKESFFMTMAKGRRVKLKNGLYKGIRLLNEGTIEIQGYDNLIEDLKNSYPSFAKSNDFLGDNLQEKGIRTGFLGEGPSSLLIANKEGKINKGVEDIYYDVKWLRKTTDDLYKHVDVLVVSYNIEGNKKRIQVLERYIDEPSNVHLYESMGIYVFPENIKGDISYKWNSNLLPIIYKNSEDQPGIISSKTTRRDGLITSLDIKTDIEAKYKIEKAGSIGNRIFVSQRESMDIIEENKNNLLEFLNLSIIKYVFHGFVIMAQLIVLSSYTIKKKRDFNRYDFIMTSVILSLLLSILYGVFNFHRYLLTYCIFIIITSLFISRILIEREINSTVVISITINVLFLIGNFFNPNLIYSSFIGYNNIVAAGRFYGLNNDVMGVLIATSIITFYELRKLVSNYVPSWVALLYLPIVIIALSAKYGANVGGYITSIILFLIVLYVKLFKGNKDKKGILVLIGMGIIILGANIYIDINSGNISHAGSLVERIRIFGIKELYYIIIIKLKQLLLISILPPWNIIIIFQIFFLRKFYKEEKKLIKNIIKKDIEFLEKYSLMFIVSIIAFIINDTGAVAFTYINTFLIASLLNRCKLELSLDGDQSE